VTIRTGAATPDDIPGILGAQRFYARHGFALKSVVLDLDNLPRVADR
jgi:hypothetical protein